jgi:hypothetical protein
VGRRRERGLERVCVVMGASVFRGDGRVVEGIGRGGCNRYMALRSACAGVLEHLDIAAGRAVIGGVVGVVALQFRQAVVEKMVLGLQGQKGIEAAAVEGWIGGEHCEYAYAVRVLGIVVRARLDFEEAGPLVLGRVCAGGVWLYADVRGEIGVESDTLVERIEEDGNIVFVEERGKVAAKELVLCVTEYVVYCSVAMEDCTLLGEDEDGDVDELGDNGIGPALLAGEFEWLLLGGSRVLGWLLVLVLVVRVVGEGSGRVVDRDWVLH